MVMLYARPDLLGAIGTSWFGVIAFYSERAQTGYHLMSHDSSFARRYSLIFLLRQCVHVTAKGLLCDVDRRQDSELPRDRCIDQVIAPHLPRRFLFQGS